MVIGISGSGNSENVLQAISYAKEKGARTIGLTGFDGGKLARIAEIPLVAAVNDMQKVEDVYDCGPYAHAVPVQGFAAPVAYSCCYRTPFPPVDMKQLLRIWII